MQTLSPGMLIEHYRIESILGVGGMGEVYRATDLTLGRSVALKVLAQQFVRSEQAVQRFMQEARAASALNHPNIVTVHEIGKTDVIIEPAENDESTHRRIHYIAMELIEGQTLRALVSTGALSLRRRIEALAQTADGLGKAHKAGIIHRDLKPENVMVTEDGYAKLLDFGLAKLIETDRVTPDSQARQITQAGTVIGTIGYMSPEQIEHRDVDHRSDVFSFGCIAYYAIAGIGPFDTDSLVETLHRIVNANPKPLQEMSAGVPVDLAHVIERCLAKKPDDRWQSMQDVSAELHEVARRIDTGSFRVGMTKPVSALLWTSVALLTAIVIGGAWFLLSRSRAVPFQEMQITRIAGTARAIVAAISPDGRYVAFADEERGRQRLFVRQVATGTDIEVMPYADVHYVGCSFSPDGNYLYFSSADNRTDLGSLYRIATLGGAPTKLADDIHARIALSPDGTQFAYTLVNRARGLSSIDLRGVDGKTHTVLATRKLPDTFSAVAWSPNGKELAYSVGAFAGGFHTELGAIRVREKSMRQLSAPRWHTVESVCWLPNGNLVVNTKRESAASRNQLLLLDPDKGTARPITNDLSSYESAAVTTNGSTIVTLQKSEVAHVYAYPDGDAQRGAELVRASDTLDGLHGLTVLKDNRVVYAKASSDARDLWVVDGQRQTQRMSDGHTDIYPAAAPDGSIVFISSRSGKSNLWKTAVGGAATQLTNGDFESSPSVSGDGRWVLFHTNRSGVRTVWRVPLAGGRPEQLTTSASSWPVASPDGRLFACSWFDAATARVKTAIIPMSGGKPQALLEIPVNSWMGGNNHAVRWRGSSDVISYVMNDNGVSNIWQQPIHAGGKPQRVTNFTEGQIFFFDWTADGRTLICSKGEVTSTVVLIESGKKQ